MKIKIKRAITIFLMVLILVPIVYISFSIITGSMKIFVVLSESMVPVMFVGDAILITNITPKDINVGDIIAFDIDKNSKTVVSHRVISIENKGNISFQTKGDNVQHQDPFIVRSEQLIGKTIFKVPYIGYLTKFSKKPILFLIFTIIPSIILILDEIKKMTKSNLQIRLMKKREEKRKRKEDIGIKINYGRFGAIILIGTIVMYIFNIPYIEPRFWNDLANVSYTNSYLMSGISFIIIQAGILLIFLNIWIRGRFYKGIEPRYIFR